MYKVTMKDGSVTYAKEVEKAMGFVNMECWNCDRSIPSGEVAEIRSAGFSDKKNCSGFLLVLFVTVFVVAFIFL